MKNKTPKNCRDHLQYDLGDVVYFNQYKGLIYRLEDSEIGIVVKRYRDPESEKGDWWYLYDIASLNGDILLENTGYTEEPMMLADEKHYWNEEERTSSELKAEYLASGINK